MGAGGQSFQKSFEGAGLAGADRKVRIARSPSLVDGNCLIIAHAAKRNPIMRQNTTTLVRKSLWGIPHTGAVRAGAPAKAGGG